MRNIFCVTLITSSSISLLLNFSSLSSKGSANVLHAFLSLLLPKIPRSQISKPAAYPQACMHTKLLQLCPTLCDPMDCSLPGSSVLGLLLARVLEWVAISFSIGPFWPRDQILVSSESLGRPTLPASNLYFKSAQKTSGFSRFPRAQWLTLQPQRQSGQGRETFFMWHW